MAVRNQPNENNARTEEEVDAQSRDYQQRLIILEKKIAKRGDRELKILQKAGLDRQAMTRLLALAVMPGPDLAETMRQFQDHLKNLSKRIDAVVDKANAGGPNVPCPDMGVLNGRRKRTGNEVPEELERRSGYGGYNCNSLDELPRENV
jgi:hypothetical protein